jgi:hypothetical protein
MRSVQIEATYVGSQPLVSVLEANLDFDEVVVIRKEYAVKSFIPLELLLTVPTGYLLTKFVLEPLIGPYAEKWKKAVVRFLNPIQAFDLTINLTDDNLILEAPLQTSHTITADIWEIVYKSLEVLKKDNLLKHISKIRFAPNESNELFIVCYAGNRPIRMVDLNKGETTLVAEEQIPSLEEPSESVESWQRVIERTSDEYRKHIEDLRGLDKPSE